MTCWVSADKSLSAISFINEKSGSSVVKALRLQSWEPLHAGMSVQQLVLMEGATCTQWCMYLENPYKPMAKHLGYVVFGFIEVTEVKVKLVSLVHWGIGRHSSSSPFSPFPAQKWIRYPFTGSPLGEQREFLKIPCWTCILNWGPSTPVADALTPFAMALSLSVQRYPLDHRGLRTASVSSLRHYRWPSCVTVTEPAFVENNWSSGRR